MPKPKLPEEDKKEVVPLRLPPAAVAAMDRIAENWGEQKGKEIKRATVARELVLIGIDVVAAARRSKMLQEILRRSDDIDRVPEIREILDESSNGVSVEEVVRAIVRMLGITPTSRVVDHNPTLNDKPIETEGYDPTADHQIARLFSQKKGAK